MKVASQNEELFLIELFMKIFILFYSGKTFSPAFEIKMLSEEPALMKKKETYFIPNCFFCSTVRS